MLKYEGVDLDFSLEGKTVIITGGAAGIGKHGKCICRALLRRIIKDG